MVDTARQMAVLGNRPRGAIITISELMLLPKAQPSQRKRSHIKIIDFPDSPELMSSILQDHVPFTLVCHPEIIGPQAVGIA